MRFDYAVFDDDRFVTNALLTEEQAAEMETRGFRCIRVRDTVGEALPGFRGRRYVGRDERFRRRWSR